MSDSKVKPFEPDLWLICSRTAFQSIAGHWREEAGTGSLLQWRLGNGLIEHVDADDLTIRLTRLAAERGGCVAVTFDDVNETQLSLIEAMPNLVREKLELKLIDWRSSPLDAVVSMNSPDRALLDRLQGNEKYYGSPPSPSPGNLSGPTDWHGYHTALLAWESGCRASHRMTSRRLTQTSQAHRSTGRHWLSARHSWPQPTTTIGYSSEAPRQVRSRTIALRSDWKRPPTVLIAGI